MLCKQHYEKMIAKLLRFEETLNPYLFTVIETLPVTAFVADKQYHAIPVNEKFEKISEGWKWGGEGAYCWLKTEYTVPESLDGKDIFIMPKMGGYEAMLWVDGVPFGTFNTKIVYTSHGNHYCGLIRKDAKVNEKIDVAIEYYAGHDYHGCDPFSRDLRQANNYDFSFESLDLSEPNYGVTVMNDCKYGVSVNGSQIGLSLHKGGTHPDVKGDKGMHHAVYSFMPHNCALCAKAVIQPSYMLNVPHIVSDGVFEVKSLVKTDKPNIIVESIKPCEDENKAFIVRVYEAEGTRTNSLISFGDAVKGFVITNMLEEEIEPAVDGNSLKTQFRPFEIKTVKAYY